MVAAFENGTLVRTMESIPADEIMVDGIGIGDVGNVVINDRRKLKQDGVMIIGVSFSMATRKIVAGPDIQMRGFILHRSAGPFIEKVSKCFADTVYQFVQKPGLVENYEYYAQGAEKVYTVEELISFVGRVANGEDLLKNERRVIRDLCNYSTDGKSSKRVVDYILGKINYKE